MINSNDLFTSSSTILDLVTLEVGLVLLLLDERLSNDMINIRKKFDLVKKNSKSIHPCIYIQLKKICFLVFIHSLSYIYHVVFAILDGFLVQFYLLSYHGDWLKWLKEGSSLGSVCWSIWLNDSNIFETRIRILESHTFVRISMQIKQNSSKMTQ